MDTANDSLLDFDTLIVQVTSEDSAFVQEVVHGPLTDPKQLFGLVLDSRVGREFTVRITGVKDGRLGMHREFTVRNLQPSGIKDVPIPDTVPRDSTLPELIVPVDTSVREGDTLQLRIEVRHPWGQAATFALKGHPDGGRVGEAGISSGAVRSANLAIDNMGTLYVAFTDGVTESNPYGTGSIIKKLSRNGWVAVGDPITQGTFTWPASFALNPSGIPHVVATTSAGKGHVLNHLWGYWHSLGREPVFSDGMGEPYLDESALAFTKTGLPFVAFRDEDRGGKTTVIRTGNLPRDPRSTVPEAFPGLSYRVPAGDLASRLRAT